MLSLIKVALDFNLFQIYNLNMQLGQHFKKQTNSLPRTTFNESWFLRLLSSKQNQFIIICMAFNLIVYLPLIYWNNQNYEFMIHQIPKFYKLEDSLHFEKNWVLALYFASSFIQAVVQYLLFNFLKIKFYEKKILPDEVVDQRHAS